MNKTNQIIIAILIVLFLIVILYKPASEETIKIGFIGPLSGDSAIIGEENLNGIKLAVEKINSEGGINGKDVKLVIKDDGMDEKETITQYRELVNVEGVDYILTVTYGGFLSLAKQAEQDNIILINSLDASEEFVNLSQNTFGIGIYDESIGYSIANYLNKNNVEDVGIIINLDDPFPLLVKDAFEDKYTGKVQEEKYGFDTKDYRTILTKLSSYEYIVLLGWEETGRIVKQAIELGITTQFIGIDTFASEDFKENTFNNYEGLLFAFWQGSEENTIYNEMISNYNTKFGRGPENILFMTTGYDAMTVLKEALRNCEEDVDCVNDKLRNDTKNLEGATGLITIDSDGIIRSIKEVIHTYSGGEIVEVEWKVELIKRYL